MLAPLAAHAAMATGWGLRGALALAGVQAVGLGLLLWDAARPPWRWAAPLVTLAMLAALAWGAARSAADGLAAGGGVSHAMVYSALLLLFGHSLASGQEPLVTRLAQRINPWFTDAIRPYTRGVTVAWCVFFAGQLAASALLAAVRPEWWRFFTSTLHVPLVFLMMAAEFAVRRRVLRGHRSPGLLDTMRAATRP